ncbi:helix-turn-helix domain-containing protein [Pseudomonas sp. R5(2019)]|uniref:AraC-like ligand-binding domain-containing protein n=1 Tax=Pseudomonas sp. R5(2019) TaxID=2697566 RepID=UPI001413305A|nr:helix-turn-helix domain-containing protein [Pseudomonas sp. R5(2019)]NBA97578.1 helix-turn-helix domain-containing protein [Pseudomonas sp. R5(2019)]
MPTTFSTQQIDSSQRLAYWNEVICKTYLAVDCQPQMNTPLEGHLKVRPLGQLELSDVLSPAMNYRRSTAQLKDHHEEHYQLVLVTEGNGCIEQDGRQAMLNTGDMALYSAAQPSLVSYPQGSRSLVLKIPRALLAARVARTEPITAVTLKGDSGIGSMIGHLMRESFALEQALCLPHDARLASGMLDIISAALENGAGMPVLTSRHNPLEHIKQHMQAHLSDPDLQIVNIASRHNVSVRTLNRLFAAEGTSAIRWLWQQRLAASHKYLSEGRVRQVSEAALDCGFNDLSHFSKAFKKTYGISPQQLLRSAR